MTPRGTPLLVALVCLAWPACNPSKNVFQLGIPGARIAMRVEKVTQRAGYLDVMLQASGWSLRTFTAANETCARMLKPEAQIDFVSQGPYGTLASGSDRCVAVGMGSLAEWRNKRGSGGLQGPIVPSAQARYQTVYTDEEVVFLRGLFPLARQLGFAGLGDAVAVVPNSPVCQRPIRDGVSTMEYFPGGKNVLTLSSTEGRCQIEGLLRPLGSADVGS